jgi:hypothetical protein
MAISLFILASTFGFAFPPVAAPVVLVLLFVLFAFCCWANACPVLRDAAAIEPNTAATITAASVAFRAFHVLFADIFCRQQ